MLCVSKPPTWQQLYGPLQFMLMGKCSEVQGCLAVGSPGCSSRFDPISSGASGQGVTIGMCGEETI